MTEIHLQQGFSSIRSPVIGQVLEVATSDSSKNDLSPNVLYQVEIYPQSAGHNQSIQLTPCAYAGEMAGGNNDVHDPLEVGQYVLVDFIEEDPNRPIILSKVSKHDGTENIEPSTLSTYPQPQRIINGMKVKSTKEGSIELLIPSGQSVKIVNSTGVQVANIKEDGSIIAGSSDALSKPLVTEDFITKMSGAINSPSTINGDTLLAALKVIFVNTPIGVINSKTTKLKGE